jgi:hypothetical protein
VSRLSSRTAELLQWFGLLCAPIVWGAHLVFGAGATEAHCDQARLGIDLTTYETVLTAVGFVLALVAEASAVALFVGTRRVHYTDPPPEGRRNLFVFGASVGNVLFIVGILVAGIGTLAFEGCRQS